MQSTLARVAVPTKVTVAVFVVASFLGSGLLFMVQPMVARMLLPVAGGSPSLWNTAMVFFQLALLAGYAYAHLSTRRFGLTVHPLLQIGLLALPFLVLPVALDESWRLPADGSPIVWVLAVLAALVGLPFFVLATSSPTLQRWFAATDHPSAHNPYFLYAAGNVGSVLALVSYPVLLEPLMPLDAQTRLWTGLYVAFFLTSVVAALITRRAKPVEESVAPASDPIAPARRARWILWSFVPSALMLGVTRYLATDVASVPLLWIVPLFLYLTTFIIAFGRESSRRTAVAGTVVRFAVIPLMLSFVMRDWNLAMQIGLHLGWFFFAALLGHSRLSEDRPAPDRLTEFYLWISVGGVAGGVFAALLAPVVFSSVLEYPIAVALGVALIGPTRRVVSMPARASTGLVALLLGLAWLARIQGQPTLAVLLAMIAVVHAAVSIRRPGPLAGAVGFALLVVLVFNPSGLLVQERSFFGVYQVEMRSDGTMELRSGTTTHGTQLAIDGARSLQPTSYYHRAGPIGQVLTSGATRRSVGIVGLGVGGLAGYGRTGDAYTFFEIDPTVVELAQNTDYFTYLSGSPAEIEVVIGDGRLALDDSGEQFDVLIIDAFNSDAIPIHLLTREAIETYLDRVAEDGLLAVHISNRHFALAPVLGRVGRDLGLSGRIQFHQPTDVQEAEGSFSSLWVVLADNPASLAWADARWEELPSEGPLWTDDYSDILGVLRF